MPNLECRMYESKYPEVGRAVMVEVKTAANKGAKGSLLEYNNIEGLILSDSSHINVGQQELFFVLGVDKDKGRIRLHEQIVNIQDFKERYDKSKLVHSILQHVAKTINIDLEDLYIHIGWPLYRRYGHAFEAFRLILKDPDLILATLTKEVEEVGPDGRKVTEVVPAVTPEVKDALVKSIGLSINSSMTLQPMTIRAIILLCCIHFDGALYVKVALKRAEAVGNNDCPVKVELLGGSFYALIAQTHDTEQGILVLNNAIKACTEEIERHKGKLLVP